MLPKLATYNYATPLWATLANAVTLGVIGSAVKTCRITQLEVWAIAGGNQPVYTFVTVQTVGFPQGTVFGAGNAALGPLDAPDGPPNCAATWYTANPPAGGQVQVVNGIALLLAPPNKPVQGSPPAYFKWQWDRTDSKQPILRGANTMFQILFDQVLSAAISCELIEGD